MTSVSLLHRNCGATNCILKTKRFICGSCYARGHGVQLRASDEFTLILKRQF